MRLAIARPIDRARIVEIAIAGFGTPASTPVPPESPLAWREAPPQNDTLRADSLLDAAGWRRGADGMRVRGGRRLSVELLTVGTGDNVVEQLLQADLAARGIGLRIRQTEMGTFLTTARAPDKRFDLLLAGITGDLSLSYLDALFATRQRGGALDYTGLPQAGTRRDCSMRRGTPRPVKPSAKRGATCRQRSTPWRRRPGSITRADFRESRVA